MFVSHNSMHSLSIISGEYIGLVQLPRPAPDLIELAVSFIILWSYVYVL